MKTNIIQETIPIGIDISLTRKEAEILAAVLNRIGFSRANGISKFISELFDELYDRKFCDNVNSYDVLVDGNIKVI